jgi:hypothetical protein
VPIERQKCEKSFKDVVDEFQKLKEEKAKRERQKLLEQKRLQRDPSKTRKQ